MNSLGLYRHERATAILGRATDITYNNKTKVTRNAVQYYTEANLRRIGWIKIAPVVLAGWCDD